MSKRVSLGEATRVWAKIGLLSFGGPAGQIALMHRVLVDEKRWIGEDRFLHALNFCMLLPGPEAQQLATYVGWLLHGLRGGIIAGTLFILPGAAVILALSYLYVSAGDMAVLQGLFLGLKPAVIVIVVQAVMRIGRRALRTPTQAFIALAAFLAMFVFSLPFPLVVAAAAAIGYLSARVTTRRGGLSPAPPDAANDEEDRALSGADSSRTSSTPGTAAAFATLWIAPLVVLVLVLGPDDVFTRIGVFFSKMAVVTFGGAYAVLAYVSQEAVNTYGWLAPGEMIDGLAMAETTPGPLIMVVQFVGFVAAYRQPGMLPPGVAGLLGAALTTWVTFVPCFLWIFIGAPHIERLRNNRALAAALAGVTAAVVGVVLNLALWFTIHALFGTVVVRHFAGIELELPVIESVLVPSLLITLVAGVLLLGFRVSVIATLAVTSLLGILTAFAWIA